MQKWSVSTVQSILQNEKYAGNAVLQKTFCQDFLSKKIVKNTGQVTQYHVTGSHEGIVTQEEYDLVQEEFKTRGSRISHSYSSNIFTGRIVCGECGKLYGPKLIHSTDKYRKTVYRCNAKYNDKKHICTTPMLTEEEIKTAFVKAVNQLESKKTEIISNLQEIKAQVLSTESMQKELDELELQIDILKEKWTRQYSSGPITDSVRTSNLQTEYIKALKRQDILKETIQSKIARSLEIDKFCCDFQQMESQIYFFLRFMQPQHISYKHIHRFSVCKQRLSFRHKIQVIQPKEYL